MAYTKSMKGLPNYVKDIRPWGEFERFTLNEKSTVKIITVRPHETLSLQTHHAREEFWHVLAGAGTIVHGEEEVHAKSGDEFLIAHGEKHRAEGGPEGLVLLEIAFGEFDEGDIVRLEDKYGRGS